MIIIIFIIYGVTPNDIYRAIAEMEGKIEDRRRIDAAIRAAYGR
jgi:hypothetical protein